MGNLTRIDLNQSGVMAESDTPRLATMAKWRRRVFWMACGLLGAKAWATLLTTGFLFVPTPAKLSWPSWSHALFLAVNLAASAPLVWMLFSGRLEGPMETAARRLANPRQLQALIIAAVALAGMHPVVSHMWQARLYKAPLAATGHSVTVAGLGMAHLLTLLWPLALGYSIWRLAPGRHPGRREPAPATICQANSESTPEPEANLAPFDVEANLSRWRQELSACGNISAENMRELEDHLRDAFAAQTARGLPPVEAFRLAIARLGDVCALTAEFDKANPAAKWRHRLFWMTAGMFGARLLLSLLGLIVGITDFLLAKLILRAPHFNFLLIACMAELATLGIGYLLLQGQLEPLVNRMTRKLETRVAVGLLVAVLPVTSLSTISVVYYCVMTVLNGPPIHGVSGLLQAVAPSMFFLGSTLLLPAWLIFLAPLPRVRLKP